MKILHIVSGDLNYGAARGAYWLHLGLKELNVDSKIFTDSKTTFDDKDVISVFNIMEKIKSLIRINLDAFILKLYKNRKDRLFSTGFIGYNFLTTDAYKDADIIHLHWINASFINIKDLEKIDKPIVWTLRDMWPFTGGCHYADCDKYISGCGHCDQLQSTRVFDLSKIILNRKIKYLPKHMKIVGISHWISDLAKKSLLFKNFDIETIPNVIKTDDFYPIDKKTAQRTLDIKTDKKIILAGAQNFEYFYKGFDIYLDALGKLDKNKYFLCFFGNLDTNLIKPLGFEYKSFGFVTDNNSLRLLYSASNVFVGPSKMDAFNKTLAESMACATPVVCFDVSGQKDVVDHKVSGYKAKPFDTKDLEDGIEWVLNTPNYNELCHNAREKILQEFDNIVVAKQYIELYKGMA